MTAPSDTGPLPELPLGKSLYDHMQSYLAKFDDAVDKWTKARDLATAKGLAPEAQCADLVLSAVTGIQQDIDGILRFVLAETKFYGYQTESSRPGTRSIVIRHATMIQGKPYVTVQIMAGDLLQDTMRFNLESAASVRDGMTTAINEAEGLLE